ncbi:MAG: LptF/LptG family permease [Bacteroidales bacterium]|nr:LptF/LptG family permease [Bacteroidales bacterium]
MKIREQWHRFSELFREKTGWKILDSYLLRKFLGSVIYSIALLMTIVVIFDLSENIQRFMDKGVPVGQIITGYYLNFIPYFINLFIPLFTFISVIWFTSKLSSHNEIVSILGNGISFRRFLRPYLVGSIIIMLVSLLLANLVVPYTNARLNEFKYAYFGRAAISTSYIHVKNDSKSYIFVERWDRRQDQGYFVTYEAFDQQRIVEKISAQTMQFNKTNGHWILHKYVRRQIIDGVEHVSTGDYLDTTFNVLPVNFSQDVFISETMPFTQLRKFIREEKRRGSNMVASYQIEAHKRVSNPLGIIIMTFLGVSVSSRKNARGVGVHIFIGMGLAFTFIFLQQISTVFSVSGGLPPVLGTWFPNLIFLTVTIVLLKMAQK